MEFRKKPADFYVKPFEKALHTVDLIPPLKPPKDNKNDWSQTCGSARYSRTQTFELVQCD